MIHFEYIEYFFNAMQCNAKTTYLWEGRNNTQAHYFGPRRVCVKHFFNEIITTSSHNFRIFGHIFIRNLVQPYEFIGISFGTFDQKSLNYEKKW